LQYLTKDFGQYDMHEGLKNIKAPTLILFGDHESTIEAGKKISEYIPDAKFVLLKNAGHFPFIEQPDAYFEAINDFLD
ncbi:MAG: prolyl aminopeptidase, partial [Bacteroidetes bacterium]